MRSKHPLFFAAVLTACGGPPPPALAPLTTPGLLRNAGGRVLTLELPVAAFVTIFGLSPYGYPSLVTPVEPLGRLSFGPLGPGRAQLRITQAALRGPSTLLTVPTPPPPGAGVWSFEDFPLIVILTSGAPLTADQIARAYDHARTPSPAAARSGRELRSAREEIASRLIVDLQDQGIVKAAGVFQRPR